MIQGDEVRGPPSSWVCESVLLVIALGYGLPSPLFQALWENKGWFWLLRTSALHLKSFLFSAYLI